MEHEPFIRLPAGFETEFPDASALATEVVLNLGTLTGGVRKAIERTLRSRGVTPAAAFNVTPAGAFNVLTVLVVPTVPCSHRRSPGA
ncbi:MAG TPA: hypothetical protein VFA83_00355 [Acidimicrobiales bacterium]|nr:hypothetical protein [Acidimicrobiales bacterium]